MCLHDATKCLGPPWSCCGDTEVPPQSPDTRAPHIWLLDSSSSSSAAMSHWSMLTPSLFRLFLSQALASDWDYLLIKCWILICQPVDLWWKCQNSPTFKCDKEVSLHASFLLFSWLLLCWLEAKAIARLSLWKNSLLWGFLRPKTQRAAAVFMLCLSTIGLGCRGKALYKTYRKLLEAAAH